MTATKNRRSPKSESPAPAKNASTLKVGTKFGYRLIKAVSGRNVTYVNTNGCKPSTKPAVEHTVSISEFKEIAGL